MGERHLTAREFFGEAYPQWAAAMEAVHAFAQCSGCPLGHNVIQWLDSQGEKFQRAAFEASNG